MPDLATDVEWFERKGNADALWRRYEEIRGQSRQRNDLNRFYCSLYHDRAYQGFGATENIAELFIDGMREKLNENVIAQIIGTLSAKLAKNKPKPTVLTDGGDWALQQRAKKYDKFIWGVMRRSRVYALQRASDLHMLITGTGAIYCGSRNGQIYCEAVPPWELFVDSSEARYGTPRSIYRRQFVDRRLLQRLYTKSRHDIERAHASTSSDVFGVQGSVSSDMIEVVTGWRLPSFEGSGDGRVIVMIEGTELDSAPWERERFPFAFSRDQLAPEGFWGIGRVALLVGMQMELNQTLTKRQEALRMLGAPFIAVEEGSSVVLSHLTNAIARIIKYKGTPPTVVAPSVISPETFQHSDRVKSSMFSSSRVSEMAATSMKPAGLNSGKALRAYADMQDDGMYDVLVRREDQIIELGELILDEAEALDATGEHDIGAVYVGPFGTERIDFADCKMDRDSFVLSVQPTSSLSTTLAGRLEDLSDMRELGIVTDPSEMQELLQLPDLNTAAARRNSMRELLLQVLEVETLDKGNVITPEPSWDLELAMKLCVQTRLRAQLSRAPADRIELLRIFESKAIWYLNGSGNPPPPEPAAPAPGPVVPVDPNQLPPQSGAEMLPEMAPNLGGQPGAVPMQ
jgi:hypothetical protein